MVDKIDFDLLPCDDDGCYDEVCGDIVPVLPTEYEESLSYYEALCKLSKKVDEFEKGQVESVNGKTGDVVLTAEDVGALPVGTPVGNVDSVNGQTGVVVLTAEDVGALPVGTPVGNVDSVNGQTGVVVLTAEDVGALPVGTEVGAVDSVNGKTGDVVLTAEDVGALPVGTEVGAVDSVNGKTGVVVLTAEDVGAIPVGTEIGAVDSVNGQTGVVVLSAEDVGALPVGTEVGAVDSVNGKTGVVVLTAEDVGAIPVGTEIGAVDSVNGQTGDVVLTAEDVGAANDIHASTHAVGGSDPITPDSIGAVNKTGDWMSGELGFAKDYLSTKLAFLSAVENAYGHHFIEIRQTGNKAEAFIRINTERNNELYDIKQLIQVARRLKTASSSNFYALFGEHNKPTGSYTGNGSATQRTINTAGIGNVVVVRSTNGTAIVTGSGAITIQGGVVNGIGYSGAHCENGVLTIATDSAFLNASGVNYNYQVL